MKLYLSDIENCLKKAFPLKFFTYENTYGSKKGQKFINYRGDQIELNVELYDDHIHIVITEGAHPSSKIYIPQDFYSLEMFLDYLEYWFKHFNVFIRTTSYNSINN